VNQCAVLNNRAQALDTYQNSKIPGKRKRKEKKTKETQ